MTRGCAMTLFLSKRSTCSPAALVARLSATYACPFSNTLPRSTLTRSSVWPCALWIESAHARMSGSCLRAACTSPVGSSTFHSSWMQRRVRCVPSVAVNRTSGYNFESFILLSDGRPNDLIFFECASTSASSSDPILSHEFHISKVASFMKPITLPRDPFTKVSSMFLINMT
ncbi:hypothetical protein F4810DRAFT_510800 [Camillea tinctor]|nr:hypothetical protein F4810DRAFT_510800 [Camillea tinctor]